LKNKKYKIINFNPPANVADADNIVLDAFSTGYFNKDNFYEIDLYCDNLKDIPEFESIKQKHLTKYYKDTWIKANPTKAKFQYYLNWIDHWDLYCGCKTEYLEMIQSNCLVDDYTFSKYKYDYYGFLDCLSPTVRVNIINKINADNNLEISDRYGQIVSLEDMVDIAIFIQDPPEFLKSSELKYYDEYNKMMYQYLANIQWDMSKFDYKSWNIIPTFQVEKIPNNVFTLLNE